MWNRGGGKKVEGSLNLNFFLANFAGVCLSYIYIFLRIWSGHDANDNASLCKYTLSVREKHPKKQPREA